MPEVTPGSKKRPEAGLEAAVSPSERSLQRSEVIDLVANQLTSYMAAEQISRIRASELLGKGPNYVAAFLRDRSEMGVYTFYKLCRLVSIDPGRLLGFSKAVNVQSDSAWSDELEALSILEAAIARIRANRREVGRPYFDEILAEWRSASGHIPKFNARVLSFLDIYDPPEAGDQLKPRSLGKRSLTTQILESNDAAYYQRELEKLPTEITASSVENQREALERGYLLVQREIDVPLLTGKRLNLQNDLLIVAMTDKKHQPVVGVFAKAYNVHRR